MACPVIDPCDLTRVSKLMLPATFNVYEKTWKDFVAFAKISIEKEPMEQDIEKYFEHKREKGISGNTMKTYYSHLNKILSELYNKRLGVSFLHSFSCS